nr:unnamed protein product [Callosobruchus chinensis]
MTFSLALQIQYTVFADDSTLHAGIMSNRPISVVADMVPKRALGSNEQQGSAKKSLSQAFRSQHYRKKLGYLFRARKYFSPSNFLTLYKAQIRPSLEYCSHIWGAVTPTTFSIFDAVQRRAIRLNGDTALTCHLQPLSHKRAVGDISLFYQYSNELCSFRASHPKAVVLHASRTERYDRTFVPRVSRAWNGLPGDDLLNR